MKTTKKLSKTVSALKFALTVLTITATVISLIPRDEKITGIDENKLAKSFMPKQA